jgi:hypothetical protein
LFTRRLAVFVAACEVALAGGVLYVSSLAPTNGNVVVPLLIIAFFGVGLLVAYLRPRHRMGWLLLGVAWFFLLSGLGGIYSLLDYRVHRGSLPLGPVAVLIDPSWAPAIVLLVLSVLLYPDGHLPSRRWRWPVVTLLGLAIVWQLGALAIAADAIAGGHIAIASSGDLKQIDNPTGSWAWWNFAQLAFFLVVAALLAGWVVSQVVGYHKLSGDKRLQQKWLLGGASIGVISFFLLIPSAVSSNATAQTIGNLSPLGLVALPVAIGIGILKFRLYDIDRLISRTLSYAIVTALLVGTFVGLVVLTTRVLPFSSTVGVAASTLAAAALFNPLRVRVQRAADHRFNRARYDAEAMIAEFAGRLRDAVDVDAVQRDLLATVQRAVEPSHTTIWMRGAPR